MDQRRFKGVGNQDLNVDSLLDSSASLGSAPCGQNEQDTRAQRQNLELIKRFLDMFNMEETMRKYETQNVVEYILDPSDFAYDCSLSTTRVRQRLCDLMGTDVIRLNDKRYFQKLSERLQEEYETVMDKQEEQRSDTEKQRMRRLMLEGVIDAPNDYRSMIHGEHKKPKKKKKRKTSRKHDVDRPDSKDGRSSSLAHSPAHSDDESKQEVETQVEVLSRPSSTSRPGSRASDRTSGTKQKHVTLAMKDSKNNANEKTVRQNNDESDNADDMKYETQSLPPVSQRYTKYSKHEPERVRELRTTETVAGLYSIAEELVAIGATDDTSGRKVTFSKK